MSLQVHVEEIRAGIKAGRYKNEASVSQGIIQRLLNALGWPIWDTQIVCPEYGLEGKRVDFALCHPLLKPIAFIEVKQIGQNNGADRQLFEYAFHDGVPLAILTDGQEWNFFLPAEQGNYSDRRVYKLDILEREIEECVARLNRYLSYEEIVSGRAISSAREDYRNVTKNRLILATLPNALVKLIEEGDEYLLELIADSVENLCGFKPDPETVARYLKDNIVGKVYPQPVTPNLNTINQVSANPKSSLAIAQTVQQKSISNNTSIGYKFDGQFINCRNGRDLLIKVFECLSDRDNTFLERFASRPKHGRKRRYLARTVSELYPGRPDLEEYSARLKSGWYIGTNLSRASVQKVIKMGCEVAGIKFGKDLIVNVEE